MTEDTLNEPVGSIADDLSAAFDEHTEEVQEVTETIPEPVEAVDEQTDETLEEVIEALNAPEHWSEDHKGLFTQLGTGELNPRKAQEFLLDRHKSMEGDYTKKTQEIADFRKTWEPVEQMYAPYMQQLQQMGITPQQHIERLANADLMLSQDPISGIQHVAQMYGIDLSQFANSEGAEGQVSPEVASLRAELAQLRQGMESQQQAEAQTRYNTVLESIESFATEQGEDGNPLRPHFDEVVDDLVYLAQAERASGREPDLQTLYDRAVWSNPQVREKILAAEKEAEGKKAEQEAIAKAAAAKKAAKSVSGAPGGAIETDGLSLRETLSAAMS